MHWFNVATLFVTLTVVGVEFSVSAFVNPAAWRLEPASQLKMLSRFAFVMGRVMPVWYASVLLLLGTETWLGRQTPDFGILVAASVIWFLATLATILFLVPLNNRVANGDPDWERTSRIWDRRHRVRIVVLATVAVLLSYVAAR